MRIPYSSGVRTYKVTTPSRKRNITRLARKTYVSMASALVNSPKTSQNVVTKLALKIREEMREISCESHDSVLRDSVDAVKQFSWETVRLELMQKTPTLMLLLSRLVGRAADRLPLVCLLASMILKSRHHHMGLVQRAVSLMLYGNGTAKQVSSRKEHFLTSNNNPSSVLQVFVNLQPLHVCMSFQQTLRILDKICEGHDTLVKEWADKLSQCIEKPPVFVSEP